ncbi:sodium/nucleoside cotransporter 1 [Ditylenchus destructor]|uniref:Sodium/nucleoside cotransporter 1 n=1 Tax=Ditylenchus destructor TaxID=166010 RepID=A0AAD4MVY1_9BILA|nr:sodium/nucleoside cotransporter 1 [Ditylenchus destructor]
MGFSTLGQHVSDRVNKRFFATIAVGLLIIGAHVYIGLAVAHNLRTSIVSANPARINWRPVIGGLLLQICIAFLVLRWPPSTQGFGWFANKVVSFLHFTSNGTSFTYGFVANPPAICGFAPVFVFTSLQIIVYFGGIVAVLYHFGIIQAILSRVALVMQMTIGTTSAESLNAAACIFLGQTEAALLIEPAFATMTDSEIHTVMTAGFACIAGSLFAAYIAFGACPTYILSATVMSAAASLAISKLIYPELQKSMHSNTFKFTERQNSTVLECISNGACHSAKFVWAIAANLIVYIALLALFNSIIGYAGDLVGIQGLSFNQIIGYCFFPVAYLLGASDAIDPAIQLDETMKVAELIGMKTVLNEFIAYQSLSQMIMNKTLNGARAKMIATYALCGFTNISMIGSQIGILSVMCPEKKSAFAKVAVRAFVSGLLSSFMTTCIAGIIINTPIECHSTLAQDHCLSLHQVQEVFHDYVPST